VATDDAQTRRPRLKILDVSPRIAIPARRGSAVRVFNLLCRLGRSHEVVGFSQARASRLLSVPTVREVQHSSSYVDLQFSHPLASLVGEIAERSWVSAPILSGAALGLTRPARLNGLIRWADVVLVEFPWQFGYCRRQRPNAPLVYASHNIEVDKFSSYAEAANARFRRPWLERIRRAEADAVAHADVVLTVSAADSDRFVSQYGADPARVIEIPNGADTERYQPVTREERAEAKRVLGLPDRPTVFFTGGNVPPNKVAAEWVRRLATQEDRFTFLLLGEVGQPRVEGGLVEGGLVEGGLVETGMVKDIGPYLRAADLSLVPVAHGGGTKIKLLESLAAGLPTVTFAEALHGTAFLDGEHVLVADKSVESLSSALHKLADDPLLADRLGTAARHLMVKRYSWDSIAEQLDKVLVEVVR